MKGKAPPFILIFAGKEKRKARNKKRKVRGRTTILYLLP